MKQYTVVLNKNIVYYNMTEKFIKDNKDNITKIYLQVYNTDRTSYHLEEIDKQL